VDPCPPHEKDRELKEYEPTIRRMHDIGNQFGLSFREIFWHQSTRDNLSFVASFGLPNRFSHWYFGGIYKNLKIQQDENLISILELVLNTDPVYAFLLDSNSHLENMMVIAHVLGHVDFFKNNTWYVRSDRDMLNKCEYHARTIRELAEKLGQRKVEDIIEASLTISNTVNVFERDPKRKAGRLMYFLRDQIRSRLSAVRKSDPRYGDLKLTYRIMSMMISEMEYFDLIGRTQIINEGWASFIEFKVLEKFLKPREWLEFTLQFSKRPAPYLIGFTLFNANFRQGGWPQVLEIRRVYEDIAFVDRFLDQKAAEDLDLFVVDKETKERDTSVKKVKEKIIEEKDTRGQPQIAVKEFDSKTGTLVLENTDGERTLDKKRTELFLKKVQVLWPYEIGLVDGETCYKIKSGAVSTEKR
jgi:spore cortex formation protein SpoVR/YcgB (stage V sporulation)